MHYFNAHFKCSLTCIHTVKHSNSVKRRPILLLQMHTVDTCGMNTLPVNGQRISADSHVPSIASNWELASWVMVWKSIFVFSSTSSAMVRATFAFSISAKTLALRLMKLSPTLLRHAQPFISAVHSSLVAKPKLMVRSSILDGPPVVNCFSPVTLQAVGSCSLHPQIFPSMVHFASCRNLIQALYTFPQVDDHVIMPFLNIACSTISLLIMILLPWI